MEKTKNVKKTVMNIAEEIKESSKNGLKVKPEKIENARKWFEGRWYRFLNHSITEGEETWRNVLKNCEGFLNSVSAVAEDTEKKRMEMRTEFFNAAIPAFNEEYGTFLSKAKSEYAIKKDWYNNRYCQWIELLKEIHRVSQRHYGENIESAENMWYSAIETTLEDEYNMPFTEEYSGPIYVKSK